MKTLNWNNFIIGILSLICITLYSNIVSLKSELETHKQQLSTSLEANLYLMDAAFTSEEAIYFIEENSRYLSIDKEKTQIRRDSLVYRAMDLYNTATVKLKTMKN